MVEAKNNRNQILQIIVIVASVEQSVIVTSLCSNYNAETHWN